MRTIGAWIGAFLLLFAAAPLLAETSPDASAVQFEQQSGEKTRDVALYRDIVRQMHHGASYYEAATGLHRARGYPLQPFFTVRLPTLAWLTWLAGAPALHGLAIILVLAAMLAWLWRDPQAPLYERLLIAALLGVSGAALIGPAQISMHETWCGLLLCLSLGLYLRGNWWAALAAAAAALAFREFALLFVGLLGLFTLWEKQWARAAGCLAVGGAFVLAMGLHAQAVAPLVQPGDLSSPPWQGMRGPAGFLEDLIRLSFLQYVPYAIAALLAAACFAGWAVLARRGREGLVALLWFAGFALFIALFARANNFYWVEVIMPTFMIGLAFLPRAAVEWRANARNRLTNPV